MKFFYTGRFDMWNF